MHRPGSAMPLPQACLPVGARRVVAALALAVSGAVALSGCQAEGSLAPSARDVSPSAPAMSGPATPAVPTPTPAAAAAQAVIDGLRAFAEDATASYRVTFTGDSRHTTDILAVDGTLDVSGPNAAIASSFRFPGQGTGRTDYRRVGGDDWVRFDRGRWRTLKGVGAAEVVDPLAGARGDGRVQYLGPVEGEAGRFRVELDGMLLHPVLIPAGNLTDEQVKSTRLVLVTDAAGRPIAGTWAFRGTGRVSGQLQAVEIDLDLAFSKLGERFSIDRP